MLDHKFFVEFKAASLAEFFAVNKKLAQSGRKLKPSSTHAPASIRKSGSAKKAA